MNDPIFWRLVWKEYRLQRAFWVTIAAAVVAWQLVVVALPERYLSPHSHVVWLFGLALAVPSFYALGCAAMLFAAEQEEGTAEQLRILAAPWGKLLAGKLVYAAASTAALLAALWLCAMALAGGQTPAVREHAALWVMWVLAALEMLAWGLLFSVLTRQPLHAAVLAAAAWLLVACLLARADLMRFPWHAGGRFLDWLPMISTRLAVVALVLAAGVFLSRCWCRGTVPVSGESKLFGLPAGITSGWRLPVPVQVSLVGVVTLGGLMLLPCYQAGGPQEVPWRLWAVGAAEGLAWLPLLWVFTGRLWTALVAAFAAGFGSSLLAFLVAVGKVLTNPYVRLDGYEPWSYVVPQRLMFVALLLALDGWVAVQWLRGRTVGWTRRGREAGPSPVRFAPLVWQEWRQAVGTVCLLAAVPVAVLLLLRRASDSMHYGAFGDRDEAAMLALALVLPVAGACVFLGEQRRRRFRFLADRGVEPGRVWLSKHTVWLPAACLIALLVSAAAFLPGWGRLRQPQHWLEAEQVRLACMAPLVCYAAGQLMSMTLRQVIVAAAFALGISFVLLGWGFLMIALGVPLWWSVLSIPVVLMFASWLRAGDWLLERRGWLARGKLAAVLVLPAVALAVGVVGHRVWEVPAGGPGFAVEQFLRPRTAEEKETADLYQQAIAALEPGPIVPPDQEPGNFARDGWQQATAAERAWLAANEKALRLTLQAASRDQCLCLDPGRLATAGLDQQIGRWQRARELARLLMLDARRLESEGKLDEALERYLALVRMGNHLANRAEDIQYLIGRAIAHMSSDRIPQWAAHPSQTPERIRRAIAELDRLFRSAPPLSDAIKADYVRLRYLVQEARQATNRVWPKDTPGVLRWYICSPWERARAQRLACLMTLRELELAEWLADALARGQPLSDNIAGQPPIWSEPPSKRMKRLLWNTPLVLVVRGASDYLFHSIIDWATRERAALVLLALEGWRHEHGRLPETLQPLVGSYLDRLPLDPWSGQQFGYAPRGFPCAIRFAFPGERVVEAGRALIWSAGRDGARPVQIGTDANGRPLFQMRSQLRRPRPPRVAEGGWAFPIP